VHLKIKRFAALMVIKEIDCCSYCHAIVKLAATSTNVCLALVKIPEAGAYFPPINMPFTSMVGRNPILLKYLAQVRNIIVHKPAVKRDAVFRGVESGHPTGSSSGTNRISAVTPHERNSMLHKSVDVRGINVRISIS
jgi:hypothetical protein